MRCRRSQVEDAKNRQRLKRWGREVVNPRQRGAFAAPIVTSAAEQSRERRREDEPWRR